MLRLGERFQPLTDGDTVGVAVKVADDDGVNDGEAVFVGVYEGDAVLDPVVVGVIPYELLDVDVDDEDGVFVADPVPVLDEDGVVDGVDVGVDVG